MELEKEVVNAIAKIKERYERDGQISPADLEVLFIAAILEEEQ